MRHSGSSASKSAFLASSVAAVSSFSRRTASSRVLRRRSSSAMWMAHSQSNLSPPLASFASFLAIMPFRRSMLFLAFSILARMLSVFILDSCPFRFRLKNHFPWQVPYGIEGGWLSTSFCRFFQARHFFSALAACQAKTGGTALPIWRSVSLIPQGKTKVSGKD